MLYNYYADPSLRFVFFVCIIVVICLVLFQYYKSKFMILVAWRIVWPLGTFTKGYSCPILRRTI